MNAPAGERLTYRTREAAEMLGVPLSTLHDLIRRGVLEAVRLGGAEILETRNGVRRRRRGLVLIPAAALSEMIERNRVAARERKTGAA